MDSLCGASVWGEGRRGGGLIVLNLSRKVAATSGRPAPPSPPQLLPLIVGVNENQLAS